MDNEFIGAIKIKDGLFIGDEYAAQDLEFIVTNKITHIINCAGRQLANFWEDLGVAYLTYNWLDSQSQIIFDQKGEVLNEVYNFITEAHANGDSVLIHSQRGQSRACCVIAGFFMKRFHWSLYKTLEFLASRRPDLEIRDSFYYQLVNLESKLQQSGINLSNNWNDVTPEMDTEELLMRNTFLNAKNAPLDECLVNLPDEIEDKAQTINWGDRGTNDINKLAIILTEEHIMKFRLAPSKTHVKSILKGSNKIFRFGSNPREHENLRNEHKQSAGMKLNRSLRTLHDEKPNLNNSYTRKSVVPIGGTRTIDLNDTSKKSKVSQSQTMARSSSASQFDKEGSDLQETSGPLASINSNIIGGRGGLVGSSSAIGLGIAETEKTLTTKGTLNFNGNVSNSTNILKDQNTNLSNVNNLSQNSSGFDKYLPQGHKGRHSESLSMSALEKKLDTDVMIENLKTLTDTGSLSININDSFSKALSNPSADKNSLNYLASKHLKMAIEKKLSKEPSKGHNSAFVPTVSDETMTLPTEANNTSGINTSITGKLQLSDFQSLERPPRDPRGQQENKIPKPKECPRPTDIKVNYQILLKNRETPPPRQRDEAKKNPESVYKKALAKSSTGSIKSKENTMPGSASYFQNVLPSSLMQSGSFAPLTLSNSNAPNLEKRIPTSTKASSQANFSSVNAGRNSAGDRSQQSNLTSQSFEKSYASANPYMDSYLKTSTSSQIHQSYPFKTQVNNFMQQPKNVPVKATYEKIDRPLSSGANMRAGTPNTALSQTNKSGPMAPSSKFDRKEDIPTRLNSSQQSYSNANQTFSLRSFSPSLKPGQQSRKESPSSQTNAKFRQRSSSPAQSISYNSLVNVGSVSKPKWKC